jgi:hypothetical protein
LKNNIMDARYKEDVTVILNELDNSCKRRLKPGPITYVEAEKCFLTETKTIYSIQLMLQNLFKKLRNVDKGNEQLSGWSQIDSLRHMYMGFVSAMNRITDGEMPYIIKYNDPLIKEHGTILLESQGLFIQVGALSDRLGLHMAYISPKKSFGHIHSTKLADCPNWEYHFVSQGKEGSHVVGDYRCPMDKANGDIVAVPINQPHGGFNHGDFLLELHFCAGGSVPWDYPPSDLVPYDVENSIKTNDITKINGMPLESTLYEAPRGISTIIDPSSFGGKYGIELQSLITENKPLNWMSHGEVAQVWSGEGFLNVVGTEMINYFSKGDKFALLPGIEYQIVPKKPVKLLKFLIRDF